MFTQVVSEITIPATQRLERPLHFAKSNADQLCTLGVYLKNYSLAGMPLCFLSPRIGCVRFMWIRHE